MHKIGLVIFLLLLCQLFAGETYDFSYKNSTPIIGSSLIMSGYSIYKINTHTIIGQDEINSLSAEDVNRFDRSATRQYSPLADKMSDGLLVVCMMTPMFISSQTKNTDENKDMILLTAESYLFATSLVYLSKVTFQRKRPYVYNDNLEIEYRIKKNAQYSFFSFHTTLAFTSSILTAKVLEDHYPDTDKVFIYSPAVAMASTVGYLRYKAGKHFPTDIITGAVVGTATGLFIYEIHKKDTKQESRSLPIINVGFTF